MGTDPFDSIEPIARIEKELTLSQMLSHCVNGPLWLNLDSENCTFELTIIFKEINCVEADDNISLLCHLVL